MGTVATYEDANLILRLYELRREERLRRARAWFAASFWARSVEEFQTSCPEGSDEHASFRMVVTYWDMAASFVTSGVLSKELFLESAGELMYVYEKTKWILEPWRQFMGNPKFLSSFETVAREGIKFMNRANPEAYATWSKTVAAAYEKHAPAKSSVAES